MDKESSRLLLDRISLERADEAFEKLTQNRELDIPGYKYILVREQWHEGMIELYKNHYHKDENVSRAIGLQWNDELDGIFKSQVRQNISIAIVSKVNSKIVSGIIMSIADENYKITLEQRKNEIWYRFVEFLERQYNVFQHYQVGEAVDLAYLCTHQDFRGKSLASSVMKAAVCFLKNLNISGLVLHGGASSIQSKRAFETAGFREVSEIMIADYTDNGEVVCKYDIEEKSAKYYTQILP